MDETGAPSTVTISERQLDAMMNTIFCLLFNQMTFLKLSLYHVLTRVFLCVFKFVRLARGYHQSDSYLGSIKPFYQHVSIQFPPIVV